MQIKSVIQQSTSMFVKFILFLLNISACFGQPFHSLSFLSPSVMPNIVINLLKTTYMLTSPMLVLFLVNMIKMVIIISVSARMVMSSFIVIASSVMVGTMLVVPWLFTMFIDMNVVVIKIISSPDTLIIIPKMIFPPVIKRIKESFLMQKP